MDSNFERFLSNLMAGTIVSCPVSWLLLGLNLMRDFNSNSAAFLNVGLAGVVSIGLVTISSWIMTNFYPSRKLIFRHYSAYAAAWGRVIGVVLGLIAGTILIGLG